MAQRQKPRRRPQPQSPLPRPQPQKSQPSRHVQWRRLEQANPDRQQTTRAKFPLVGGLAAAVAKMVRVLDRRMSFRLAIIVAGMLLADDRRTASSWFVAAGVLDDWDRFYDALIGIGRQSREVSVVVLRFVIEKLDPGSGGRITLAIDDTPEKRYGRHVEGAGVPHDPTPGPAGGEFCDGHNWVWLAWLAKHPRWGVIALSLRSRLYLREVDIPRAGATDTNPKRKRGPVSPRLACASGWFGGFTECVIAVRSGYNVWSNIGCWHLNQWLHTLVELASWDEAAATLVNRTARPWDNANRRPSHADRRRTMALEILRAEFPATRPPTPETPKYLTLAESLLDLCT